MNSATSSASCGCCHKVVFLKKAMITDGVPADQCARNEFDAATSLEKSFASTSEFGVVKPLGCIGSLLIFEHIDGSTPVQTLKEGSAEVASVMMDRLGLWFAKLHGATNNGKSTVDLSGRLESLVSWSHRRRISVSAQQALGYLQQNLPASGDHQGFRRLHGDAKPENFLIDRDRVVGIDVGWRFLQHPENDLAQFLNQYELQVCGIFGHIEHSRRQSLETAFVEGYRSSFPVKDSILAWLRVYSLLRLWVKSREAGNIHRFRWERAFMHRLDCLLLELGDGQ